MKKIFLLGFLAFSSVLSAQTPIQVKLAEDKLVE